MKLRQALAAVGATTFLIPAAGSAQDVDPDALVATYIGNDDIAETILQAPPDRVSDRQIRHVEAPQTNLGVGVVHRPALAAGEPYLMIRHHRQSEVYRVLSGRGRMVTTTDVADEVEIDPDGEIVRTLTGPSSYGKPAGAITERVIAEGDVVIIPAGVAHGFSEIDDQITYLVVRIDPDRLVELK